MDMNKLITSLAEVMMKRKVKVKWCYVDADIDQLILSVIHMLVPDSQMWCLYGIITSSLFSGWALQTVSQVHVKPIVRCPYNHWNTWSLLQSSSSSYQPLLMHFQWNLQSMCCAKYSSPDTNIRLLQSVLEKSRGYLTKNNPFKYKIPFLILYLPENVI